MPLPNRLIVDTSVLINYLRARPGLAALESASEIYLPAMVLAELQIGWLRAHGFPHRQIQRFEELVSIMFFLPILRSTVSFYNEVRRNLELVNSIIPENDLWIAATAKEHDLPLLTVMNISQGLPAFRSSIPPISKSIHAFNISADFFVSVIA